MCGIAGFISNNRWREEFDTSWIDGILQQFTAISSAPVESLNLDCPLGELAYRFDDLMSFGLHLQLVAERETLEKVKRLADLLDAVHHRIETLMGENGRVENLEQVAESARDFSWQLRHEVLGSSSRATALLPLSRRRPSAERSAHFTAWAVEQVLANLDRLEVRGRDSAGIAVQCMVSDGLNRNAGDYGDILVDSFEMEKIEHGVKSNIRTVALSDGRIVITFVYKIANLVGRLGDNTAGLRQAIRKDELLWKVAGLVEHINIIAHTRWASNGIISLANCHPVDGILFGKEHEPTVGDKPAQFVLNGDVDNYQQLLETVVHGQGYNIDPSITTDAKILPVFYRLGTDPSDIPSDKFSALMNKCEGSLAIVMQHPHHPQALFLGEKGSGQSLFVGKIHDGLIIASEVYGLASHTRRSYSLSGTERGGTQVCLEADPPAGDSLTGRFLEDLGPFSPRPEPIYIHSRDIYRGSFDYYFEKEIREAPASVIKTIKGKYRKIANRIEFNTDGYESFGTLLGRLRDAQLPPIRRIMVIGQGTASVAAMGVAHLVEKALARSRVSVRWCKASEMSGFLSEEPLVDMLLIAISQSGTTTDTNRTVDVAGSQGAWIHAIVNRRNSPLVEKADSHCYTSDGRDVEMAVASTKAFYSQVAAGKLMALLLAREFESLTDEEIFQEVEELERLPVHIQWVLDNSGKISDLAEKYGPSSRNWAVVGNGPNKIAADEIRIKLSELCYKSIPCDFTEDKKHIDLSTEPLTIVVANDLPEQIVQDTAKEVAIFRAHNGKPLVICARGEKRFADYAESLIEVPYIGAGLGFVPATVAGHLWGFYAAKAIDLRAERLRGIRSILTQVLEDPHQWNPEAFRSKWNEVMGMIECGEMNTALPASIVASLALFHAGFRYDEWWREIPASVVGEGIGILNKALEEMTRPIDTIRHQAKTVTVGISRPQEVITPLLLKAIEQLSARTDEIKEPDRRQLRIVSPLITEVHGGLFYRVIGVGDGPAMMVAGDAPLIQVTRRFGSCEGKYSRYDQPRTAGGTKRTALRLGRSLWSSGRGGQENLLVIPLFDEKSVDCKGILLFHLNFAANSSLQQKIGVLKGLGSRYHEVVERLEDLSSSYSLEDFLEAVSPRDLILAPVESLVTDGVRS